MATKAKSVDNSAKETVSEAEVQVETPKASPDKGGILVHKTEFTLPGVAMGFITSESDFTGVTYKAAITILGTYQAKSFKREGKNVDVRYFQSDCTGGNEELLVSFIQQINPNHNFNFRSTSLKGRGTSRGEVVNLDLGDESNAKSFIAVMKATNPKELRFPQNGERIVLTVIVEVKESDRRPIYLKYWAPFSETDGTFYDKVDMAKAEIAGLGSEQNLLPAA